MDKAREQHNVLMDKGREQLTAFGVSCYSMAFIKKITMYVAVDEDKFLNDSYYKERIEDDIENGYTQEESLSNRAEDAFQSILENAMCVEAIADDFEIYVESPTEDDEKSFEYRELVDRLEEDVEDEE